MKTAETSFVQTRELDSQRPPSSTPETAKACGGSAATATARDSVTRKDITRKAKTILSLIAAALMVIACAVAAMTLRFGSVSAALAFLGGDRLLLSPIHASFGQARAEEPRDVIFRIENLTGKSVRIVGSTWSCTCMTTKDLPLELTPGERRKLSVIVRPTPKVSGIAQHVTFFTDFLEKPVLTVHIQGTVVE